MSAVLEAREPLPLLPRRRRRDARPAGRLARRVDRGELVAVTGPVRLGQVDAAGLPGRPRRAGRRHGAHRRRAALAPPRGGAGARCAPARHRHALPAGEPGRAPDHRRQRRARAAARRRRDRAGWRAELLERCGIAAPRATPGPRELSGGELARAGLAVALANDPAVLLADEPTGELDEATAARVLDAAARARRRGRRGRDRHPQPARSPRAADREIRLRDGKVEA